MCTVVFSSWADVVGLFLVVLCPQCGAHHDRDLNAALNIKRSGMDALISGCKSASAAAMLESRILRI